MRSWCCSGTESIPLAAWRSPLAVRFTVRKMRRYTSISGSDQVKALAAKAGISPDLAGTAIAQILPGLVDKLTPNGQVPAHNSVMDMVSGLLQNVGKAP